ncbi:hypothetical protein SAMN04488587_0191 [Methanococcoides vulcani]|uniref:Uncharacterized protein n=1 Tax=Methanococcoides vulcani TaxID=1353158 RepID=A0A1H9Y383_9EURY|nr:hypothetical protein [Methanococcoides vulcani]SES63169.1 hypothetical protein SAMN04488587_0191 [Methanococcoides vulcani]
MLVGKRIDDTALWCPRCEGIELLSKSESLSDSGKTLSEKSVKKNKLFKSYTQKSIIGSLCATLEVATMLVTNLRHICSTSYAIKDVLSKNSNNFGHKKISYEDLQELLHIYEFEFQELFVNHSLIQDDYVVGIKIPKNKISEYAMNEHDLQQQKEIAVGRFTEDWNFNRLVAIRNGLYSDREIMLEEGGPKQWSQKPFWNSDLNRFRYGFQFAAGTSKLSTGLKSNVQFIGEIEHIASIFSHLFVPELISKSENSGNIIPTTKNQILNSLSEIDYNQDETYDKLVNIEFPLIVEVENLCFVLPNTCKYYLQLLYSQKYDNELILEKTNLGTQFEELVFMSLNLFGYDVNNPNDNNPLLNFDVVDENDTINGKTRSFELDVAGFNEKKSVIVECKHWDIGYNFFKRRSIEKRKRELQKQLEKFHHKIELLKVDGNYNFLTEDKTIDAYMVTLHPEPINEYKGIKVIPFTQFNSERFCEHSDDRPMQEIKLKKGNVITTRKYQDGKILSGVDYTKMIMNPYGLNKICLEPENELKSHVFIGDGVVNQLDEDELTIIPPDGIKVIIDLIEADIPYLKSKKIKKGKKVRYQIYTKDPLFGSYYLRFIKRFK